MHDNTQEENTSTNKNERDKFYNNLNSFLVKSGVVASAVASFKKNISEQAHDIRNEVGYKLMTMAAFALGLLFLVYGIVELIAVHFDLALYTNIFVGAFLLLCALIIKAFRK